MAQDMFIKMAGIDGESNDSSHKNEIDVIHWEWQIKQASDMHSASAMLKTQSDGM
ncbi:MAG TPA: type VI secretion system tube protein Hcp [Trinickia sp.]|nr:type VI secretion system tube protein Hcp [Trinickia sp.]